MPVILFGFSLLKRWRQKIKKMKEKQFSEEDTRKIGIFYPSELKKLQSRVHTDGQLWLMDDLLRRIIAFMPEKRDYHCEWHGEGVYYGALEWMLRLRPPISNGFFYKKRKSLSGIPVFGTASPVCAGG